MRYKYNASNTLTKNLKYIPFNSFYSILKFFLWNEARDNLMGTTISSEVIFIYTRLESIILKTYKQENPKINLIRL